MMQLIVVNKASNKSLSVALMTHCLSNTQSMRYVCYLIYDTTMKKVELPTGSRYDVAAAAGASVRPYPYR
jgi:hypothetical protein